MYFHIRACGLLNENIIKTEKNMIEGKNIKEIQSLVSKFYNPKFNRDSKIFNSVVEMPLREAFNFLMNEKEINLDSFISHMKKCFNSESEYINEFCDLFYKNIWLASGNPKVLIEKIDRPQSSSEFTGLSKKEVEALKEFKKGNLFDDICASYRFYYNSTENRKTADKTRIAEKRKELKNNDLEQITIVISKSDKEAVMKYAKPLSVEKKKAGRKPKTT